MIWFGVTSLYGVLIHFANIIGYRRPVTVVACSIWGVSEKVKWMVMFCVWCDLSCTEFVKKYEWWSGGRALDREILHMAILTKSFLIWGRGPFDCSELILCMVFIATYFLNSWHFMTMQTILCIRVFSFLSDYYTAATFSCKCIPKYYMLLNFINILRWYYLRWKMSHFWSFSPLQANLTCATWLQETETILDCFFHACKWRLCQCFMGSIRKRPKTVLVNLYMNQSIATSPT